MSDDPTVTLAITPALIESCHPTPIALANLHAPFLQQAIELCDACSPNRVAGFLGQFLFECGWLREMVEEPSSYSGQHFEKYDGRNGNNQPGDGYLFRGRGYIQLTGRELYAKAGAALSLPLVAQPDLAAQPAIAARIAAWYWQTFNCNTHADAQDWPGLTRAINGGLIGYDFRLATTQNALKVLNA